MHISNYCDSERLRGKENKFFEQMMSKNLTEETVFIFRDTMDDHIPSCIAYRYPNNRICNYELPELWTSVYNYNRSNLIENYENEKDLCLVINQDEEPTVEFADIEPITAKVEIHSPVKFYFLKK